MSSWFDAKQLTSFAKSALTEAQKTLDKALDIQEEKGGKRAESPAVPSGGGGASAGAGHLSDDDASSASSVTSTVSLTSAKLWGSFTGSFFDAGQLKAASGGGAKEADEYESVISSQPSLNPPSISSQPFHVPPAPISSQPHASAHSSDRRSSSLTSSSHSSAVMEEVEVAEAVQPSDLIASSEDRHNFDEAKIELKEEDVPHSKRDDGFSTSELVIPDTIEHQSAHQSANSMSELTNSDELNSSMSSSHTVMEPCSGEVMDSSRSKLTLSDERIQEHQEQLSHQLDEAMDEVSIADHEKRSETSSSKSYEVVKAGSGHTSGDEFETTTTSSDIEVIASPTQGLRASPNGRKAVRSGYSSNGSEYGNGRGLLNKLGHTRTSSEISAAGSEESGQNEVDRLLKKIGELSDVLEARETKMVELSRANLGLQEKNTDLSSQVKEAMKINLKLSESNVSSEDLTNRLSALEKKLQKTLAEKDALASENTKFVKDSSGRMSQNAINVLIQEKDEIIEDLRHEGESLSKQVGKHTDVIKKLRSKEKSNEKEIKTLKTELDERRTECDRLKKSLSAKDEVESKQIEAIQNLTSANSKWEEEHNRVKSDLEDAQEKVSSLKTSLESAYKEIAELKRGLMEKEGEAQEMALSREMAAKQALQEQLRELQEQTRKEKENLFMQIDELRSSLSGEERATSRKEEHWRRENESLMARLEQSENRHEELSGNMSAATRPLLRQIESLQANINESHASSDRVERSLSERLQQMSIQLAAAQERERTAAEQYMQVSGKTANLETKLNGLIRERTSLEVKLEAESLKRQQLDEVAAKASAKCEAMQKTFAEEAEELRREKEFLEASFESEKADLSAERRKNIALADQLRDRDRRIREIQSELDLVRSRLGSARSSPSQLSMNGSMSEQFSMNPWPDEVYDVLPPPRNSSVNIYESMRQSGSTAAVLEGLQAQLKQREGELVQMQMELGHLERSRDNLTAEVTRLSQRLEAMDALEEDLGHVRKAYGQMEQKYQTMLTMYGEKVEEAEELRLDLADVKDMYKTQIEELVRAGK